MDTSQNTVDPREWWREGAVPSSPLSSRVGPDLTRRRIPEILENLSLPPRPADLDDDFSFMDDDDFVCDKKSKLSALSRSMLNIRKAIPTTLLVIFIGTCCFLAGTHLASRPQRKYEVIYPTDLDLQSNTGLHREEEVGRQALTTAASLRQTPSAIESPRTPSCGLEYTIAGGTGYGGHSVAAGCIGMGQVCPTCSVSKPINSSSKNKRALCTKDELEWLHGGARKKTVVLCSDIQRRRVLVARS